MANPNLKAQIEAAKSALASGLAAPSLVAPPPEQPTAPNMAGNDIATDANAKSTNANSGNAASPIPADAILANPISADGQSAHATNAAALDERITRLEAKLLDNQRDLHTLLQKIREVSRLQANSSHGHQNPANDQAETMVINEAEDKAVLRHSQRSSVIMVAMAALIGLVVGLAFLLATDEGGSPALTAPSWVSKIIDSFNGWTG
jgi:hypothetical protein